jgi:hypothetical protein
MATSFGSSDDVTASGNLTQLPNHRYNTRSSRDHQSPPDSRYPNDPRNYPRPNTAQKLKPVHLSSRPPPSGEPIPNDADEQELDSQLDMMMDQISSSAHNPVKAPFPSPAMKHAQPFYPFPPTHPSTLSESGWGGQTQHQGGAGGQCILVEAANRAQMAILVDDMGSMGFEQMEQT